MLDYFPLSMTETLVVLYCIACAHVRFLIKKKVGMGCFMNLMREGVGTNQGRPL